MQLFIIGLVYGLLVASPAIFLAFVLSDLRDPGRAAGMERRAA
ncbi:hypothetical protein [Celeribacter indicus]|nr:hypothetical protein [Celeribacter indicus]SDW29354.1 hypothetical protein SAMN05443573_102285 [Celeribacter indicus]